MHKFLLFPFLLLSVFCSAQMLPFLNEVDYQITNNPTTSIAENGGVGVAGPSGLSLTGYVVRVLKTDGTLDAAVDLSGFTLPNTASNRSEVWVDVAQCFATNDPDVNGMFVQLVSTTPTEIVLQTLSFGGSDPGAPGGITNPVFLGATAASASHQLTGTGCNSVDFAWSEVAPPTPGAVNGGQTFSDGSGACPSLILPVRLLDFSARAEHRQHVLRWTTAAEWNNDFFTLESSTDGRRFTPVTTVAARNEAATYVHRVDAPKSAAVHYYRLRQTDFDGTTADLGTVTVRTVASDFQLAPNPVVDRLTLRTTDVPQRVELFDGNGRRLRVLPAGRQTFDVSELRAGWYVLRLFDATGEVRYARFLKQ